MTSTFGGGYFGVGNYSAATPVEFTGSMGRMEIGGAARVTPQPVLRGLARPEFRAESGTRRVARADGFFGNPEFGARAVYWKGPVLRVQALTEFVGRSLMEVGGADAETLRGCFARIELRADARPGAAYSLPAALGRLGIEASAGMTPLAILRALARPDLRGQASAILVQPIRLQTGRIEIQGRTGPFGTDVAFRRSVARNGLSGALRAQIWALYRGARAPISLQGAFSAKADLVTRLDRGQMDFRASARMSYEWSDQTAPGRHPAPAWGGVSEPTDSWQTISAEADNWQEV